MIIVIILAVKLLHDHIYLLAFLKGVHNADALRQRPFKIDAFIEADYFFGECHAAINISILYPFLSNKKSPGSWSGLNKISSSILLQYRFTLKRSRFQNLFANSYSIGGQRGIVKVLAILLTLVDVPPKQLNQFLCAGQIAAAVALLLV